ncbi:MAG: TonB-dependent receptor plug domain-containing protein [Akkermansiaceae bacterium]
MKQKKTTSARGPCWRAVVARGMIGVLTTSVGHAEIDKELESIVVSALRSPRQASDIASTVTVFDPREWEKRGLLQLREALNESPGVISTSTGGQTGALGSVFIRGTNTAYSQLVVDGMRLSDSTTPLGNMLGAARSFDLGRVEVLRGAQGAAYGGESIGGVLWLETDRGKGNPNGTLFTETGSFDSFSTAMRYQGEEKNLSYFLSGAYEQTDNDGAKEPFHQGSVALRLEQTINSQWQAGLTYRGVDAYYNNQGNSEDRLNGSLFTIYLNGQVQPNWKTSFIAGHHQELYDSQSSYGNYGTDMRATNLIHDHEWSIRENLILLGGIFAHRGDFRNTIGTDQTRDRYGIHLGAEWETLRRWKNYMAWRWEDYDAFGKESTWRIGSAYQMDQTGTTIRAGMGSSFRAPTYLDLFGSSFGAGNPDLRAESSLGWDFGMEQKIAEEHALILTIFHNNIDDRINSFSKPRPVNLNGEAHAEGLEAAIRGSFHKQVLQYRLAWTYLPQSLSEQPRHHVNAGIDWTATDRLLLGIGLNALSDHSWGGSAIQSYAVGRLHASYKCCEHIRLHARWENFTNESYLLSNFYGDPIQAAGSAVYGGFTIDW